MQARILIAVVAFLLLVTGLASRATASTITYDFTFTSGGMDATGTISVLDGVAQSGSIINVTGVPLEANSSTLISAAGSLLPASGATDARNRDGDVITYDNVVTVANDPVLSGNGLGFGSDPYGPSNYNTLINVWGNSPGSYTLFIGEAQLDPNGNVVGDAQYVYHMDSGSFTLTPVPEPAALSLLALGGLAMLRRRKSA